MAKPTSRVNHTQVIMGRQWAAYQCSRCFHILLARGTMYATPPSKNVGGDPNSIEKILPGNIDIDSNIPVSARRYLKQAIDTLSSPDAAIVMASSAVDMMLKELGYKNGNLYPRIEKAVKDHILTEAMGKWAHAVRLEANAVRHADEEMPENTTEEAKRVLDFAQALGDFLFVFTARVEEGIKDAGPDDDDL